MPGLRKLINGALNTVSRNPWDQLRDKRDGSLLYLTSLYMGVNPQDGQPGFTSPEDSMGIIGPPRTGKTTGLLIPQLLTWYGPAIVTSTKEDILHWTGNRRQELATSAGQGGEVLVYAPTETGLVDGVQPSCWSPLDGCTDPTACGQRVDNLLQGAAEGVKDAQFWQSQAAAVLKAYFHAAALDGQDMAAVMTWLAATAIDEPARLLLDIGTSDAQRWGQGLMAMKAAGSEAQQGVWATARSALRVLDNSAVLRSASQTDRNMVPRNFLTSRSTLYIVSPADKQAATAPLVAALIESIVSAAMDMAREQGGRLHPPLLLALDEVANIAPLPSLPSILSQGGGQGVIVSWAAQDLSQMRDRWEDHLATAIWASSRSKIVFGGITDTRDLETISQLCGEDRIPMQHGGWQTQRRLPVDRLAHLPKGNALLLTVGFAPILVVIPNSFELSVFTDVLQPFRAPAPNPVARPREWQGGLAARADVDVLLAHPLGPPMVHLGHADVDGSPVLTSTQFETVLCLGLDDTTVTAMLRDTTALAPARLLFAVTSDTDIPGWLQAATVQQSEPIHLDLSGECQRRHDHVYWDPTTPTFDGAWAAADALVTNALPAQVLLTGALLAAGLEGKDLDQVCFWLRNQRIQPVLDICVGDFVARGVPDAPFLHLYSDQLLTGSPDARDTATRTALRVATTMAEAGEAARAADSAARPLILRDWVSGGRSLLVTVPADDDSGRDSIPAAMSKALFAIEIMTVPGGGALRVWDGTRPRVDVSSGAELVLAHRADTRAWEAATHRIVALPTARDIRPFVEKYLSEAEPRVAAGKHLLLTDRLSQPAVIYYDPADT